MTICGRPATPIHGGDTQPRALFARALRVRLVVVAESTGQKARAPPVPIGRAGKFLVQTTHKVWQE